MRRSLFPASTRVKVGRLQTIANVIAGGIELVKFGIEAWRTRKAPKRADEILDDDLMVERIRRDGHMSVGLPERDEL